MNPMPSFSKMSGKLAGIQAINTNTATNPFCIKESKKKDSNRICGKCYSVSMLSSYRKNCQPAFQRNSEIGRAHVRTPVTSLSRMPSSA